MRRRYALAAAAVGAVALGAGGFAALGSARLRPAAAEGAAEPAGPPAPAVTVATATTRPFRDQLFVSGTLVAREDAQVGVQIDGLRIAEVLAEDGDTVTAGQVLARLDRTQLDALLAGNDAALARAKAAIVQAEAQVTQFEALSAQAAADLERGRQLGSGVISTSTLESRVALARSTEAQLAGARGSLAVARADLQNQEAARRELEVRIGRTEVRAPVAGTVSRRTARIGMLAMGSAEPLFRIIKDGALDLDAEAPDDVLARVRTGMAATVRLGGVETAFPGSVRLIMSEVDRATRLGRVRIALPVGPGRIGAFASAIVDIESHDGVAVPASAVTRGERGRAVQVVRDGVVELRRVETGLAFRNVVEITEGLKPGEEVVARAAAFLRAGDAVRPIRPAEAEARPPEPARTATEEARP